ncbi:unnamed protein product [Phytomonas sp. EM1]|nr:unnamed protein product [Phytomonas sp. EM1]|eukprot:CCW62765.1 unnamed protein product [Phytomonas sp. isolate EM1]
MVGSAGVVLCWRVPPAGDLDEEKNDWRMTLWRRNPCEGAAKVQVKGLFALVSSGKVPVVYLFDATGGELVRVVETLLPLPRAPVCLLPDGHAFVAPAPGSGLLAWESKDGSLCTAPEGYNPLNVKFPIEEIVWADAYQLAAFRSPTPIPASCVPAYSALLEAFHASAGGSFTAPPSLPGECTLITVAGCPRSTHNAILASDARASERFAELVGGDAITRQETAARSRQLTNEHWDRTHPRIYPNGRGKKNAPWPNQMLRNPITEVATTSDVLKYSDKGLRFQRIINFWKGLVRQHRYGKSGVYLASTTDEPLPSE